MAARILLRQRSGATAIAALTTGYLLVPKSSIHAEAASEPILKTSRKSIYDDSPDSIPSDSTSVPKPAGPKPSQSPTPTDRLARQVAQARLGIHSYAAAAEDRTNALLTRAFNLEHSFTSTIASLAPGAQTNERVLPGAIYVLIAAMGSSILVRNRNILLRASAPVAVGIGAGYALLPVTMKNVGDLVWHYEMKWPVLADTHLRVKERVVRLTETGIAHSKMGAAMLEEKIGEAREKIEGWVAKGK